MQRRCAWGTICAAAASSCRSPLAREEVARRINDATAPASGVFGRGIFGWARFGRLRLRVRDGWWMYRAKPVLAGRIEEAGRGSRLRLNHRAPIWVPAFLLVWYPILVASAVGMISEGKLGAAAVSDVAIAVSVLAFMLIAPLGHLSPGVGAVGLRPRRPDRVPRAGSGSQRRRLIGRSSDMVPNNIGADTPQGMPAPPSIRDARDYACAMLSAWLRFASGIPRPSSGYRDRSADKPRSGSCRLMARIRLSLR